ncbi:Uncharacterised protein [uncultured archaeon]|nr:Uncharacterised protein [uncultured archaeon]
MPCLQILSVRAGVTAGEISAGVIFCPGLFSDIAVTEGVVLLDELLDAVDLFSSTMVGFVAVEFTAAIGGVIFSTAVALLDGNVTLLFAAWLLEGVGSVGAEVMVEVFRVSGVVAGAGVAALCSAFATVVVTSCVDGLVGVD